jgi:hypothetical protein
LNRWPHGDPNAVVKEILAQPAYQKSVTGHDAPVLQFWYEFWRWVDHVTSPFFKWLDRVLSSGHGTAQVVTVLVVAVTTALVAFLIYRLAIAFARPLVERRRPAVEGPLNGRFGADEWRALAAECAASGEYARAIAALFAAALSLLDESALVPFDSARTPGEYRRLVRRENETIAGPFDVLTERFVHAAFAEELPRRGDFEAASAAFGALRPLVKAE